MDEESLQPQAQNENVGDEANVETSPVSEPQASQESAEDSPASDSESEERRPNRAERRIKQLTEKLREAQGQTQAPVAQSQPMATPPWESPTYQAAQSAYNNGEITLEQLTAQTYDISRLTANQAAQGVQAEVQALRDELRRKDELAELTADFRLVEAENPRLNPKSPEYDRTYDDRIHKLYEQVVTPYATQGRLGQAPKLSEFLASVEALAQAERSASEQQAVASMARHASNSGLSPSTGPEVRGDEYAAALAQAKASGRDEDWVQVLKLKEKR
jgi:hypothetical protein